MKKIVIGIDIGGTNTAFGLVEKHGEVVAKSSIPTQGYSGAEEFTRVLCKAIKQLILRCTEKYKLVGAGVGAPNGNFLTGTIDFAPNLKWGNIVPLAKMIKNELRVPVKLTNDANAGALGELLFGGAENKKDFIFITLGTGLGSGIVSGGKIIYGHDGFAGEMGHVIVKKNGRKCGCGRKGCLETYVSATGIIRTAKQLLKHDKNSSLHQIKHNEINGLEIYKAAKNNDKVAIESFDFTAKILGKAIANAAAYLSPEAVFLFGGLANAHELLLKPVKKYMEENLMPIYKNKIEIVQSELKEGEAAIAGAGALIYKYLATQSSTKN